MNQRPAGILVLHAVLSAGAVIGCRGESLNDVAVRVQLDSTSTVVLGASDGPGSLGDVIRVDIDRQGRFWVFSEQLVPMVFESDGTFVAAVSEKGEGPGEMSSPYLLLPIAADSVGIVDGLSVHIFSSGLEYARTVRMPLLGARDGLVLEWPDTVIMNVLHPSPPAFGQPLHHVSFTDVATIITSFGTEDTEVTQSEAYTQLRRSLARSRDGGYWSADVDQYHIEKWSRYQQRRLDLSFRPHWFNERSSIDSGGPERPPSSFGIGVGEDSEGRVWAYFLVPAEDWAQAWDGVRDQLNQGDLREIRAADVDRRQLYDTRIEIIDPETPKRIASLVLGGPAVSILPGGRIAQIATAEDGSPRVRIQQLEIVSKDH